MTASLSLLGIPSGWRAGRIHQRSKELRRRALCTTLLSGEDQQRVWTRVSQGSQKPGDTEHEVILIYVEEATQGINTFLCVPLSRVQVAVWWSSVVETSLLERRSGLASPRNRSPLHVGNGRTGRYRACPHGWRCADIPFAVWPAQPGRPDSPQCESTPLGVHLYLSVPKRAIGAIS